MTLDVKVYDTTAPWDESSLLDTLDGDFGRSLRAVRNDAGTWQFSILADDPQRSLLTTHRWVKFYAEGERIMSGRIGHWDESTVEAGEESEEIVTFSGGSGLSAFRDAIVHPHPQAWRLRSDTRFFNFATPEYGATADFFFWIPATELFQQGDDVNSVYGDDAPEDWPDPTAWWIWSRDLDLGEDPPMPVGDTYYRTDVLLTEGDYSLFIAADDGYELWVDGVMVAQQVEAFQWRQTHKVDLFLEAGTHTVAIKGTNIVRTISSTNGAAVVFAMYKTVDGGELDTLVLHSDSTWAALDYPTTTPGFTAGEIALILIEEAYDRDALWVLWGNFDEIEDTDGGTWDYRVEIGLRVGENYLDVLRKLAETYVDLDFDDGELALLMWKKGARPNGSAVAFATGSDLGRLHRSQEPRVVTDLLVHQADGEYTRQESGNGSDGGDPHVEQLIEGGAIPTSLSAGDTSEAIFDELGDERVYCTWEVEDFAGQVPIADWWPGKVVTIDGDDVRVEAISVADREPSDDGEVDGSYDANAEGVFV